MAAHEHHPQLVVCDGVIDGLGRARRAVQIPVGGPLEFQGDLVCPGGEGGVAAEDVEGAVARDAEEPPAGILRNAGVRPLLQRLEERFLHDFFRQLQVGRAEDAREPGDHLSRAAAEQMVDQVVR